MRSNFNQPKTPDRFLVAVTFWVLLSLSGSSLAQSNNNQPPFGWVDTQAMGSVAPDSSVLVSGWAADPEDGAPVSKVQLVLDGTTIVGNATLGLSRADVATAFNDAGYSTSGWTFTYNVASLAPGPHTLAAVAYDSQGASAQLQGAASFTMAAMPFGWVDPEAQITAAQNTTINLSGWAADAGDASPVVRVQLVLDGTTILGNASLGLSRPDVATYFNDSRLTNSGWTFIYNLGVMAAGQHTLTAIAYDSQGASEQLRGKTALTVTNAPPFGWLDTQTKTTVTQGLSLQVSGWAASQAAGAPVARVQLLLDGNVAVGNATTGFSRPDVSSYFSDSGYAESGWLFTYNVGMLSPGQHSLTAVAYDVQGVSGQLYGSATFTVTATNSGPVTPTDNAQVAAYSISAPDGSSVSVEFGLDTNYGLQTSQVPAPAGGGTVRILVAGMKPNTDYHMRAETHMADGSVTDDADQVFTTGSYPSNLLSTLSVTHFNQSAEAPGVQMLDCLNGSKLSLAVADRDGNLIWAYTNPADANNSYFPPKLLPNGNFLVQISGYVVREVDLSNATIVEFTQNSVQNSMQAAGYQFGTITLHHDIQKLPNGHYILLGQIQQYVTLTGDSTPTLITGDILMDVDANLNIKWVWNSFDHLDVNRHPVSTTDWTHSNAVVLTSDGNLLLSMRHQSWVLKIDYQNGTGTGSVLWRLGYQGDFTLSGGTDPVDWFYLQHYPNILSENNGVITLAVFDNGDNRLLDPQGDACGTTGQIACYSRAVVMNVDQTNMTATIQYQHTLSQYSFWGGSIQQMANGNYVAGLSATSLGSRAEEFTGDSAQSSVWQMDVIGQGVSMYRSLRLPSLYPGVTWH